MAECPIENGPDRHGPDCELARQESVRDLWVITTLLSRPWRQNWDYNPRLTAASLYHSRPLTSIALLT